MAFNKVMFSSLKLDWQTPEEVYKKLDLEFHFNFDPCPPDPKFDGLKIDWGKCNFVNPPYGREIGKWCKKAHFEWMRGNTVIMLIPSRTDTNWWHDYIMEATEIRFIKRRLRFKGSNTDAPFPSCVVVFRR